MKKIKCSWCEFWISIIFMIASALNFFRIDSPSHSVSDTLRPWIIQTLLLAVILLVLVWIINKHKK